MIFLEQVHKNETGMDSFVSSINNDAVEGNIFQQDLGNNCPQL